jgi:ferredoxin-NADP reductase
MMWQRAKVLKIVNQTGDFRSFILKPRVLLPFKSGNFVELAVSKKGPFKCYSVVSSPSEKGVLEVGVKLYKDGALSPGLFLLKQGDFVLMRGPMGVYFEWVQNDNNTILIAGGSGICPMVSILRQYTPGKGKLSILFSTKPGSVYYGDEIKELTKNKGVRYKLIETGKADRINKSLLGKMYGKLINEGAVFYIAGPTTFVQDISFWLHSLGANTNNIKTDDFGSD